MCRGWAQALDKARVTMETGTGLGWGDHSRSAHTGTERFFRPLYEANLVSSWIPALDGVEAKLRGANVADVGCGHGASTIIMARAYPQSTFTGVDSTPHRLSGPAASPSTPASTDGSPSTSPVPWSSPATTT